MVGDLHLRVLLFIIHVESEQIVEEQKLVLFDLSLLLALVLLGRIVCFVTDPLEKRLEVEPAIESFVLVLCLNQTGEVILGQISQLDELVLTNRNFLPAVLLFELIIALRQGSDLLMYHAVRRKILTLL